MEFNDFLSKSESNDRCIRITLEDFPDDIYILLENEFRAKFFKTAWKINRSYRHLAKKMGVSAPAMLSWRRNKTGSHLEAFISMKCLRKILTFCPKSDNSIFDFKTIEENVKCIRARGGKLKIYDPKFPINDSIKLREIIIHLLCDGSALIEKFRTSKYASTSLQVVSELKEKLIIFGNISSTKIRKRIFSNHYHDCHILTIPKALTKILSHKFNINFRSSEGRMPKEFFHGEREYLIAVVRTFIIDEGCIRDRTISCCSGSLKLLKDLKLICDKLGYQCQKIRNSNRTFYLNMSPNSFEKVYNDIMKIEPLPVKEKQELLDLGIKILNQNPDFLKLNDSILALLERNPSTSLDLAKLLFVNSKTIGERLLKLEGGGLIRRLEYRSKGRGGAFIWKLC